MLIAPSFTIRALRKNRITANKQSAARKVSTSSSEQFSKPFDHVLAASATASMML
jgi:hypothetical protein